MSKHTLVVSIVVSTMITANISFAGYATPPQEYFEASSDIINIMTQNNSQATQQQTIGLSITITPNEDIDPVLFAQLKKEYLAQQKSSSLETNETSESHVEVYLD